MIGGKSQGSIRPVALGSTIQVGAYGQTIPVILGLTKSPLLLTWAANLRTAGSKKKGGGGKGKKAKLSGQTNYVQNINFLMGHNPIAGPLAFWENQNTRYPLKVAKYTNGGTVVTIPDPNFYQVIGVTVDTNQIATFADFGDPLGSRDVHVFGEMPLWNAAYTGPNPTLPGAFRFGLFYYWKPQSGPTLYFEQASGFGPLIGPFNIYYAQLDPDGSPAYGKKASGTAVPAGALHFTFEPVMGNGPEYEGTDDTTGQDLEEQRILYPHYAGLGSPDFEVAGSTMPKVSCEVLGSYPTMATGDVDFADMIEDVFHQGQSQPGFAPTSLDPTAKQGTLSKIQRGLNCYDFPGPIQMKRSGSVEAGGGTLTLELPMTPGNFLVAISSFGGVGDPGSVSDTAGSTWTPVFTGVEIGQVWWAQVGPNPPDRNTVELSSVGYGYDFIVMEIAGCDTFDLSATGIASVKVTTNTTPGYPGYALGIGLYSGILGNNKDPSLPLWNCLTSSVHGVNGGTTHVVMHSQTMYYPGQLRYFGPSRFGSGPVPCCILAFKSSQPAQFPRPLGEIIDYPSLDAVRRQDRAAGLWGSLCMDSQRKGSDWLSDLYEAAVAAPVWSGFKLKSIPRSEVSAIGNGSTYIAPTASGPIVRLRVEDFASASDDSPLIEVQRESQVDTPGLKQYEHPSRTADYNDVTVSQPETGAIAMYGPRKEDAKQMRMFQDPTIARSVLGVQVRRQNDLRSTFAFTLKGNRRLLEPMDLVQIPDPDTGLWFDDFGNDITIPVRLTSVGVDEGELLPCEAEPFVYGTHDPKRLVVTASEPYQPQTGLTAGDVNAPIIFEPVPRLSHQPNQGQLWIGVSSPATNYGGCVVHISTDGGNSYHPIGSLTGSAVTGVLTAEWPSAPDPDMVHALLVDVSESLGELSSYQAVDRDDFVFPCYVEGGTDPIPYEVMAYAISTLLSPHHYVLS